MSSERRSLLVGDVTSKITDILFMLMIRDLESPRYSSNITHVTDQEDFIDDMLEHRWEGKVGHWHMIDANIPRSFREFPLNTTIIKVLKKHARYGYYRVYAIKIKMIKSKDETKELYHVTNSESYDMDSGYHGRFWCIKKLSEDQK